jgi:hypothetical protein
LPAIKSIIIVGFYVVMLVLFFSYNSEQVDVNHVVLGKFTSTPNIYQKYIENIGLASMFSMIFNMFCARIELGSKWYNSSFVLNRWAAIDLCLLYSGAILFFLMFFVPNPIILWRIYQILNFVLVAFLDFDTVEYLLHYFFKERK